jgi:hypothetical protein
MDLAEFLSTAAPRIDEVTVCARGDLVARHAELVDELAAASEGGKSLGGNSEAERICAEIVAVQDEQAASSMTLSVQSIGGAWGDLVALHPPSKDDRGSEFDKQTFPVAAVAACVVPPITTQEAADLHAKLPDGEWKKLWLTVYSLNALAMPHPKLLAATELLRANGRSLGTPAESASPGPSSLAGSGDPSPSTTTETTDD